MLRFLLKLLNLFLPTFIILFHFRFFKSSFKEDKQVTVMKYDNQLEVGQVQSQNLL